MSPPMSKFFEVLHMGGTPWCWATYYHFRCHAPSENTPNSCNTLQIFGLDVLISLQSSPPVDRLDSDRIQLSNVRTLGIFGLDLLPLR